MTGTGNFNRRQPGDKIVADYPFEIAVLFVVFLVASLAVSFAASPLQAGGIDHELFGGLLATEVSEGMVDYRSIKEDPSVLLEYLRELESLPADEYEAWDRETKIALWINAYNAITIYGIVKNYPIEYGGFLARRRFPQSSIRQIGDFWDTEFSDVMGGKVTLNDIEHEILRKEFGDPRIHFSLVCAAMGCPLLSGEAYTGERLDGQLEDDARRFINNSDKVRLDREENRIYLSSIFKWYAEDFSYEGDEEWVTRYNKSHRGVISTVVRYIDGDSAEYIRASSPKIEFLDYDWSLNERK
jgi:hypothetical protein